MIFRWVNVVLCLANVTCAVVMFDSYDQSRHVKDLVIAFFNTAAVLVTAASIYFYNEE